MEPISADKVCDITELSYKILDLCSEHYRYDIGAAAAAIGLCYAILFVQMTSHKSEKDFYECIDDSLKTFREHMIGLRNSSCKE